MMGLMERLAGLRAGIKLDTVGGANDGVVVAMAQGGQGRWGCLTSVADAERSNRRFLLKPKKAGMMRWFGVLSLRVLWSVGNRSGGGYDLRSRLAIERWLEEDGWVFRELVRLNRYLVRLLEEQSREPLSQGARK